MYSPIRYWCYEKTVLWKANSDGTPSARCGVRCFWWCMCIVRKTTMAKKQSESFPPEKRTRVSAEVIWRKPLSEQQKATLEKIAKRQRRGDDSRIDFSDIPALTSKQLAQMQRPRKRLVAVRLDSDVLAWLQQFGPGYSTRINHVLRAVMLHGTLT